MAKKRSDGEGSLYFSESENTWIAEITLPDGRRKKKRNKKQQVVKDWLLEYRNLLKEDYPLVDERTTLAEFLAKFLEDTAKHTLKPKTYSSYKWIIEKHVIPEIGRIKLASLKPPHLQKLYSDKIDSGLSKKTVLHIHSVIRRALNEAIKWGLINKNPCSAVTPPRPEKSVPEVWSVEQAQEFLQAVREHRWYAIYLIALTTGARRGEILGLEWENIDFTRKTVSIQKTVSEIRGKPVIGKPKTQRSRRKISLPDIVIDALKELGGGTGFVFTTSNNTPITPRNLLRHYYSVLDDLDIPRIRFHDLRHTAATILLTKDVHPKKVQELLGHSSITLTLDTYSHVIKGIHSEAAEKMDGVFKS